MTTRFLACAATPLLVLVTSFAPIAGAVQLRPLALTLGGALVWRPIGPSQAGPITAIAGDPSRHGVFYAGATGAGLWGTTDFGANWRPLFDAAPTGLVTSIAVARSALDVLYVTTSDSAAPDATGAVYASADAGATWRRVTVLDGIRPDHVAIDPDNPLRVFVAARSLSPQRPGGLFRSTDGGTTFDRVLDVPDGPGRVFVVAGPTGQTHVVATGRSITSQEPRRLVMQSTDGGTSWQPATGIPPLGDDDVDVAARADGTTFVLLTTSTDATLYHSTMAGNSWTPTGPPLSLTTRAPSGPRLSTTRDGALLVAAGALIESRDNGATFMPANRSPERPAALVWAHPSMAGVHIAAGADGVVITVNDGETWSAADALPTAIVDRVSVDTSFPYRVCAAMHASVRCAPGSSAVRSRAWEALPRTFDGSVVSDPLDPEFVLGGPGLRYDRRTGQTLNVEPAASATAERALPMAFSTDGRTLYAGAASVWRTTDGGQVWTAVSPALSTPPSRISALAVSPIDARVVWAGLEDGRLFITRNGGAEWLEGASPAGTAAASIRSIEPSRFDTNSAYVVATPTGDRPDAAPRLARTRDNGTTWVDLGARIDDAEAIHAVREDPLRRGLLFAGTDRSVVVSFDDGETWQSLALNLPATPVMDLTIKDADLIAGTAGRGVWILDDLSPLRQMTPDVSRADLFLFRPAQAWRVRASDEPRAPADAPASTALLAYTLGRDAGEVTLEVIETTTGDVIRRYSNQPGSPFSLTADAHAVPASAGLHRVAWDLRYLPPVPGAADAAPGTMVLPGTYQVRLTVDGRAVRQAITVRMDPRIRTAMVDLTAQRDLGRALDTARAAVQAARADAGASAAGVPASGRATTLATLADDLDRLARVLQQADVRPAARVESAIEHALERVAMALGGDSR